MFCELSPLSRPPPVAAILSLKIFERANFFFPALLLHNLEVLLNTIMKGCVITGVHARDYKRRDGSDAVAHSVTVAGFGQSGNPVSFRLSTDVDGLMACQNLVQDGRFYDVAVDMDTFDGKLRCRLVSVDDAA